MQPKPRVYGMSFASIYPLYVQKAEKKGRTRAEVDEVIFWLTGHQARSLKKVIDAKTDLETFFAQAPRWQPNATLITGVVCGVRIEEIEDETMRKIRYLDKLVDELAKGRAMHAILRTSGDKPPSKKPPSKKPPTKKPPNKKAAPGRSARKNR